jgi:short-subunit dehydrogenase
MKAGASIVNNLSIVAEMAFANAAAYVASKHGALGFTKVLRLEARPLGIRVMELVAGATDTGIWDQFWPDAPREKMMAPESVAAALVSALKQPAETCVEEIRILPTTGTL